MKRYPCCLVAVIAAGFFSSAPGQPPPQAANKAATSGQEVPEMPLSRRFLAGFGLPTDDQGLLGLLRDRSFPRDGVPDLIRQLGAKEFRKREEAARKLVALEGFALPALQDALKNPDEEIASRAAVCIGKIEKSWSPHWLYTVVNVLGQRKPAGTFETFLAFLPFTDDPLVEEEIYYTLDDLAAPGGGPLRALERALEDPLPARRAVAACILARRGSAEVKTRVRGILKDADPQVRLRAAQGLLAAGETLGIPTLIELLDTPRVALSWQAEELLRYAAEEDSPSVFVGSGSAEQRGKCQAAWRKWHETRAKRLRLADRHARPGRPCLLMLFQWEGDTSKVWTTGCDGLRRYEFSTEKDIADWLPEGALLAWGKQADMEILDLAGKTVRRLAVPLGNEVSPRYLGRLPGGNLVGVDRVALAIVEWGQNGRKTRKYAGAALSMTRQLFPTARLYEVERDDPKASGLWEQHPVKGKRRALSGGGGRDVQTTWLYAPLRDDGFLVRLTNDQSISELDAKGRVRRKFDGNVVEMVPLRNGNFLCITGWSRHGIEERTPEQRTVWEVLPRDGDRARHHRCAVLCPLLRFGFPKGVDVNSQAVLAEMLRLPEVNKRRRAARKLAELPFDASVERLARKALDDPDGIVSSHALVALASPHNKDLAPRMVKSAIKWQGDVDVDEPGNSTGKALRRYGAEAVVPLLVEEHEKAERLKLADTRLAVITILARCFPTDAKAQVVLKKALRDPNKQVRRVALRSLPWNWWHQKGAMHYLTDLLRAIDDQDPEVAGWALSICHDAGLNNGFLGEEVLAKVLGAVKRKETWLRVTAVRTLGRVGKGAPTTVPALVSCLTKNEPSELVTEACHALSNLTVEAKEATSALIEVVKGTGLGDSNSRYYAIVALGGIGPAAHEAVPLLIEVVREARRGSNLHQVALAALRSIDPVAFENLTSEGKSNAAPRGPLPKK